MKTETTSVKKTESINAKIDSALKHDVEHILEELGSNHTYAIFERTGTHSDLFN